MDWRESAIRDMLDSNAMTGFVGVSRRKGTPRRLEGFILFRSMADEGEILSLAIRPELRRRGLAGKLLKHALLFMGELCVRHVFLEVSAANRAAITFYRRSGFKIVGVRPRYYMSPGGTQHSALVFRITLSPTRKRGSRGNYIVMRSAEK
jgi:[ribosomal protein S18]-alanine N-acetyltransferase